MRNKIFLTLILALFKFSVNVIAQKDDGIISNDSVIEFYGKSDKRIKKIYYYDTNGKLHPEVKRFTRRGKLKHRYIYEHGKYLLSYTYSTSDKSELKKPIKVNGLKIGKSISTQVFLVDSSILKTETINQIDENGLRQGKWYIRDILPDLSNGGFTYTEYYFFGVYINGEKYGEWKYYDYFGGQLKAIITYKRNIMDGNVIFFHANGLLSVFYEFEEGERNGRYESYYKNGQIREKGTLKNGKFVGEYTRYKKSGKIATYIKDSENNSPLDSW